MLFYGVKRYLLYQEIKNTPTSKVESAAVGLVELFGKAKCQKDLFSPVSGVKCVYYRVVGEYFQPGKGGGWRTIYYHESSAEFYLEDETGRMLIDPRFAEVDIPSDLSSEGYKSDSGFLGILRQKIDDKVLSFIDKDPDVKPIFDRYSSYDLRVTEYFIAQDDPLFVLGKAEPQTGAASDVAQDNLIIRTGIGDIRLYISDNGERKIIEKMRDNIALSLVGGLIISAIGLITALFMAGNLLH